MHTSDMPLAVAPFAPAAPSSRNIIVDGKMIIPTDVLDLETYRRWAQSDDYPPSGWVSYLNGSIWVDTSMEELITHSRVKAAYSYALMQVLDVDPRGDFVPDRMLYTNAAANLSTEPDGLVYLWSTLRSGRLRLIAGKQRGYKELEGSADLVMEILSDSSGRKDKEILRELYWKAGVTEYWLIDALTEPARFDILRRTDTGFIPIPADDGWLASEVLGRQFRLVRYADPLGNPKFKVEVR